MIKVLVDKVAPRPIENINKMAAKLNDIIAFLSTHSEIKIKFDTFE